MNAIQKAAAALLLGIGSGAALWAEPLIDRYGQFADLDFKEKVHSDEELKSDAGADESYYRSFPIPERTFWGGLPGSKEKYGLTATGFFHLEKVAALRNREMLVDPEGNLYFHIGMSVIQPGNEFTRVQGREEIYEWLPEETGAFQAARRGPTVSFYLANWIRKYGSFDPVEWQRRMIERCRRWGFNSHGTFTSILGDNARTGFAIIPCLERYASGREPFHRITESFIDPFDEYNIPLLEKHFARRCAKTADRPETIGYFTENERFYSSVITEVLNRPEPIPAKRRFARLMEERYRGEIGAFNRGWKQNFRSFDEIASTVLKSASPEADADIAAYEECFFDAYYRMLRDTLKKVAPHQLFCGERMLVGQLSNTAVVKAMGRYCDIVSINYYTDEFSHREMERFARLFGRPLLLSEWSYGSNTQGLFGVQDCPTQEERGRAYSRYAENAAASPYVVGHQYFALVDESNTGRGWNDFNGERFQLGFVNVCDRPYREFIRHAARSNARTYAIVTGEEEPLPLPERKVLQTAEAKILPVGRMKPDCRPDAERGKYPGRPGEVLSRSVEGKEGRTADFICGWNEEYFYILFTVPDDTPATNDHTRHVCLGDGVELFFGASPAAEGRMLPGDRQLLIRANRSAAPEYLWCVNGAPLRNAASPLRLCRIAPDRKSWSMEVAVPWKELGIEPRPGVRFRFDAAVAFSSQRCDEREDKLVWNGLEENYCCRNHWGTVVLEN